VGSAERTRLGDEKLVVAGWVLEARLGSGGYGEVWRAHRRHLDLQRALKLVRISGDEAFESWRHEISRLEELSHPHVVRFYDADLVTDGPYRDHAWIATELCERSLADELARRPDHTLAPEEVERLLDQILDALSAALSRGCVHRDVKPANLLRHSSGVWKLCDFGTARLVPEGATHPVTQVIGTSPYMSAAALRGHQNHAADLYALGVTVHEALCGRLLHPRPAEVSELEYARAVIDTPPTISHALPRRWQTTVAALIGLHGPLDAPTLGAWFRASRGAGDPPAVPGSGRELRRTLVTELASPAPAPAAAAGRNRQMFVPAPAEPTPGRPPPPGVPAASQGRPPPPPAPPLQAVPPAGSQGRPPPPIGGAMAPGGTPMWARALQTVDPSLVLRRRAVALIVDAVVVLVLIVAWYLAVIYATYTQLPEAEASREQPCQAAGDIADCFVTPGDDVYVSRNPNPLMSLTYVAPTVFVFVVLQGRTGYTPGKYLRGLRVVGADRRPPGMRRALVRTLLWVVDGFPWFVPLLGLLVAGRRRDRRRIGDLVAGTWVIDRKPPPGA
jgi:serine/threonine protein kinase/uncharacterized RDD family membrane protein YckC